MESSGQQFAVSIEISKIKNRERNRIPVSESGSNWEAIRCNLILTPLTTNYVD
jgi:hypothetical protein